MIGLLVASVGLAGCQSSPSAPTMAASGKSAALRTMEQVAIAAQKCWFASKDESFRAYRMANELNSFSGRPRILLVPAQSPEARPLLVVQAEGSSASVEVFGPLMDGPERARVTGDVRRWAAGDGDCGAAA